jgi:hypothetical protein
MTPGGSNPTADALEPLIASHAVRTRKGAHGRQKWFALLESKFRLIETGL